MDRYNFHVRSDGRNQGFFSLCKMCENARGRAKYAKFIDKERARGKAKNQVNKKTAIDAYGGECMCCGEAEMAFLSIDHIDGSGAQHRKNRTQGWNLYIWLRQNNFPEGFQVLCYNCNWAKSRAGGCPHQRITPLPLVEVVTW